jgi:hypothetical protein
MKGPGVQQWHEELRATNPATSRKQKGLPEDHQTDSQNGGFEVKSQVFNQTVEETAPTNMKEDSTSSLCNGTVGHWPLS